MELSTVSERADRFVDDEDLHIKVGEGVHYRMILTPKHSYVIDERKKQKFIFNGLLLSTSLTIGIIRDCTGTGDALRPESDLG